MPKVIPTKLTPSPISALPFSNVGPVSLPAMPGLSVIAPTTIWRPSLVVFAHANVKFMAVNRCMSLSCAMASGRSSSIPMKPLSKSCAAFKHLTNRILIPPMHAFLRPNSVFACYFAFVIILVVVSNSWSINGSMLLTDFRKNCLVGGILRLLSQTIRSRCFQTSCLITVKWYWACVTAPVTNLASMPATLVRVHRAITIIWRRQAMFCVPAPMPRVDGRLRMMALAAA